MSLTARRNNPGMWSEDELRAIREEFPIYGVESPTLKGRRTPDAIRTKACSMGIAVDKAFRRVWSKVDLDLLRKWYPTKGKDIPELQGRFTSKQIISRASSLGLRMEVKGARAKWTPEEDAILYSEYPIKKANIPALLKDHSENSIIHRARRLGLTESNVVWTEEYIQILREEYPTKGPDIEVLLEKFTRTQIGKKAGYLGLHIEGWNKLWTPEEERIVEEHYQSCTAQELCELLPGRSPGSIYAYINKRRKVKAVAQSATWHNDHIAMSSTAYTGTDGVKYVFIQCTVCNRILILAQDTLAEFTHGELCETRCVPEGICLPQRF